MRLLLIEDDRKTAGFVVKGLREAGFVVEHAANGLDGLVQASAYEFDALIVDIMLPELDGISLIKKLRQDKPDLPILILSAKYSLDDKVRGLEIGADDYLTKPFAMPELMARINALLRRSSHAADATSLEFAGIKLDLLSRRVQRDGKNIDLNPREFALLEYLLRNRDRVVTRTMILEHVWDMNFDPSTNIVDVLICRLREKVDKDFSPNLIQTVRGVGYALREDN